MPGGGVVTGLLCPYTPPLSSTWRASASLWAAPVMMPSWSRSHCTAEPVTAIERARSNRGCRQQRIVGSTRFSLGNMNGSTRNRCIAVSMCHARRRWPTVR